MLALNEQHTPAKEAQTGWALPQRAFTDPGGRPCMTQLRAGIETGRFTPRCEIGIVKRQRLGNRRAGSCGIHDIPTGVGHSEPSRV